MHARVHAVRCVAFPGWWAAGRTSFMNFGISAQFGSDFAWIMLTRSFGFGSFRTV